jgi:hypothetical protein
VKQLLTYTLLLVDAQLQRFRCTLAASRSHLALGVFLRKLNHGGYILLAHKFNSVFAQFLPFQYLSSPTSILHLYNEKAQLSLDLFRQAEPPAKQGFFVSAGYAAFRGRDFSQSFQSPHSVWCKKTAG